MRLIGIGRVVGALKSALCTIASQTMYWIPAAYLARTSLSWLYAFARSYHPLRVLGPT